MPPKEGITMETISRAGSRNNENTVFGVYYTIVLIRNPQKTLFQLLRPLHYPKKSAARPGLGKTLEQSQRFRVWG